MTPPPPRAPSVPGGGPTLHYGPADGPQIVLLQPLFEEMNRTRALDAIGWRNWQDAVAATLAFVAARTGTPPATAAIRGGALLDATSPRRWRFAPVAGASLLRDLERAGLTGEAMAGYALSDALRDGLRDARPEGAARTVRLAGDDAADRHVEGPRLWRRPEPEADEKLAAVLAEDILTFSFPGGPRPPAGPAGPPTVRQGAERAFVPLPVAGSWIAATIDGPPDAARAWIHVTGGTQTRVGPNRLYERLAAGLAAAGEGVIRYDRRGVGDSPGADPGYAGQGPEIAAAVATLRAAFPAARRIAGFGLCDGATALALHGRPAGIDRLVLANPWVIEPNDDAPPAAAIRAHYRDRLRDPAAWTKLLRGGVDVRGLFASLRRGAKRDDTGLAARVADGVPPGSTIVLADGDNTARAFTAAWKRVDAARVETVTVPTRSHSFAGADAFAALAAAVTTPR